MSSHYLIALSTLIALANGTAVASGSIPKTCRTSLDQEFAGWKLVESQRATPVEGDFDGDAKRDLAILIVFPKFDSARLPNVNPATQVVACLSSLAGKAVPVGRSDELNVASGYIEPIYRSSELDTMGRPRPTDGLGFPEMSYWFDKGTFVGDTGITDADNE